jgi:hypothetical protein
MASPFASMGQQLLDAGVSEEGDQQKQDPAEMNDILEDFGEAAVWVSGWISTGMPSQSHTGHSSTALTDQALTRTAQQ